MRTFSRRIAWIQAARWPPGTLGKERLTRPLSSASKNATSISENYLSKLEKKNQKNFFRVQSVNSTFRRLQRPFLPAGLALVCKSRTLYTVAFRFHAQPEKVTLPAHVHADLQLAPSRGLHFIVQKVYSVKDSDIGQYEE